VLGSRTSGTPRHHVGHPAHLVAHGPAMAGQTRSPACRGEPSQAARPRDVGRALGRPLAEDRDQVSSATVAPRPVLMNVASGREAENFASSMPGQEVRRVVGARTRAGTRLEDPLRRPARRRRQYGS
jgi:hypothetical protein